MRVLVAVSLASLILAGCASQPLYQWGAYDQKLYESYEDPQTAQEFKVALEEHIARAQEANLRVPPGLYAELGTLYLQEGAVSKAVELYRLERTAWPESKGLMDALISNLERSLTDNRSADK